MWVKKSIFEEQKYDSATMNEDFLKQVRYYKSKGLLHTISVTNLYGEKGCVYVANNEVLRREINA